MPRREPIVAIDGPAGSGKSTVAKRVAERTGLQFISSGAMYRAVAFMAIQLGIPAEAKAALIDIAARVCFHFSTDTQGIVHVAIDGSDVTAALHDPRVSEMASCIATIPALRQQLVHVQQQYGRQGGVIMEGRDIQTVVFPEAEIKVFLTASEEERARRRWKELIATDDTVDFHQVLRDVQLRDQRDAQREASPLCAAPDAIIVDTDTLTIEQVVDYIVLLIHNWRTQPVLPDGMSAQAVE